MVLLWAFVVMSYSYQVVGTSVELAEIVHRNGLLTCIFIHLSFLLSVYRGKHLKKGALISSYQNLLFPYMGSLETGSEESYMFMWTVHIQQ
jgi:hypothetical protein